MFPQTASEPVLNQTIPSESLINEQPVNQNSTGNRLTNSENEKGRKLLTSISLQESTPQSNQIKKFYKRITGGSILCSLFIRIINCSSNPYFFALFVHI